MTPDQGILPQEATEGFSLQTTVDRRRVLGGLAAVGIGLWLPRSVGEARQTEAETLQKYPPEFGDTLQVDQEIAEMAKSAFEEVYPIWVERWVVDGESPDQKRVIFNPDKGTTNSEVQAIGMELAASVEDWDLFDKYSKYVQSHLNPESGLMTYMNGPNGEVINPDSVTDTDLGIAYAYVVETQKRGKYTDEAFAYQQHILDYDVDPTTFLLRCGSKGKKGYWGGPKDGYMNPSYNITGAYLEAYEMFGDERWLKVKSAQEWHFDEILRLQSGTGLFPNWSDPSGRKVDYDLMKRIFYDPSMPEEEFIARLYAFSHEAGRIFQRVGTGALWHGSEHDKKILANGAAFFASRRPGEISGYTDIRAGEALVNWPESLVLANVAVALTATGDVATQRAYLEEAKRTYNPDSPYVTNQAEPQLAYVTLSGQLAA